jgi:ABC-type nitrate/sulfonate/bicarbonate transport system permease component
MSGRFAGIAQVAVSLGLILIVWSLASAFGWANPDFVPSPASILAAAVELHGDGVLLADLSISLRRAAFGFVLGSVLGVVLGLLTARLRIVGYTLHPFLNVLRPIPAIALAPLAIVWFGIGEPSKYFLITYTVFLAVWLNTDHGASHVATTYIRAARVLGAGMVREFFEVVVPAAAPHIVSGIRLGAALAFLSLVAAELTGASAGIGYRIQEARQFFRTDRMFVGLVELGVLGGLLDYCFLRIGRRLVHWEQA